MGPLIALTFVREKPYVSEKSRELPCALMSLTTGCGAEQRFYLSYANVTEALPDAKANAQEPTYRLRLRLRSVFLPERRKSAAALAVLVLASYLFRLPPLLNARSTNSDAAVVGLQAMHVLHGEYSAFLWGSGYQTSADAFVAAGFFAILGSTPLALMLSSLTLHVLATAIVFATLRRRFPPWGSFVLTLPLVVSPSSVHTYALYPPRQLSITLAIAALSALHRASSTPIRSSRGALWLAASGMIYGLAISADPYPMVLAPIVLGYGIVISLDRSVTGHTNPCLPLFGLGSLLGLVPFALLRLTPNAKAGPLGLSTTVISHNWDLLTQECLPWALSYKVYYAHDVMDYRPWAPPIAIQAIQLTGAIIVAALIVFALVVAFNQTIPRPIRSLGAAGAMACVVTVSAFLVSVMVMDHFSMRYLAMLTLMLPFAAAPAAHVLGAKRFAVLLAPHLVASSLCGWVGYGPFVHGPLPVSETPELRDDYALFTLLRTRGITYAEADYWASYRLTFLFGERIVVVPTNPSEDRYPPYRQSFEVEPLFAYVFDPGRSRERLDEVERMLGASVVEKTHAGGDTVFIVKRGQSGRTP